MTGGIRLRRALAGIAIALLSSVSLAQTRGIFVTPIPNVPLMAVVNTQTSRILADGTRLDQKTLSAIARDAHGRIFNEKRALEPVSATATPPILTIHIYDPQSRTNTFIDPVNHTAWQQALMKNPASSAAIARAARGRLNSIDRQFACQPLCQRRRPGDTSDGGSGCSWYPRHTDHPNG